MNTGIWRDRRGSVTVLGAVAATILIGMAALVTEYGHGLLTRVEMQRVADLAAYAGASVYNMTSSSTSLNAAVANVASLNGLPTGNVTPLLVNSPSGDGNQAVKVTVTTSQPLYLARVLGNFTSLTVNASAYAELKSNALPCILALLASGTGVTLQGSGNIVADACDVSSDATVSVPCGTSITTPTLSYNSATAPTALSGYCGGIEPPAGKSQTQIVKKSLPDPLAGYWEIYGDSTGDAGAAARLATVSSMSAPSAPSGPTVSTGTNVNFAYSTSQTTTELQTATNGGCTATYGSNTWTVTCNSGGTYTFGNITLGGGINLNFNTNGSSSTTYNFSGSIDNSGNSMSFGPGTYNIVQGIVASGGAPTTFGAGTYNIGSGSCNGGIASICDQSSGNFTFDGPSTFTLSGAIYVGGGATLTFSSGSTSTSTYTVGSSSCNINGYGTYTYSICNNGHLIFDGPSTFALSGGIGNSGGKSLTAGSGYTDNSYDIGAGSDGNAIYVGGGSYTYLGDATGSGDVFQAVGNINSASGGGSCLFLPAAAEHDIKGFVATAGGDTLGSGIYTVTKYVGLGINNGGDVSCNGTTVGMNATGVTLVIGGSSTIPSGTCQGDAFCVAQGYNHVTITAPTGGNTADLAVIGPTSSSNTAGATLAEGATNTSISGVFYFPWGPITLSGGASLGNGSGQCLEIIGSEVTLKGGTATASTCIDLGASVSTVLLVQ